MNYERIYNNLISSRKLLNRKKNEGQYFERHHIIPKCLGGNNRKDNLILLTFREHFLAHWLLVKIYSESKIIYAFNCFCLSLHKLDLDATMKNYEYARRIFVKFITEHNVPTLDFTQTIWIQHPNIKKNKRIMFNEFSKYEKEGWVVGRVIEYRSPHTQRTKRKIGDKHIGKPQATEHVEKVRTILKNRCWVTNGVASKHIDNTELEKYLNEGWRKGRVFVVVNKRIKGTRWINKDKKALSVKESEVDEYLKNGWMLGRYSKGINLFENTNRKNR